MACVRASFGKSLSPLALILPARLLGEITYMPRPASSHPTTNKIPFCIPIGRYRYFLSISDFGFRISDGNASDAATTCKYP
ncbi:hypothetical protein BDZ45DRAFT_640013 [Acephala macrosclerotiorum]|nr:hypothetical protein BDZ45DRAFT_640013 [Acephala macrosclerotiorum]